MKHEPEIDEWVRDPELPQPPEGEHHDPADE